MAKDMAQDKVMQALVQGRSLEDQVEHVRAHGTHALPDQMRFRVLESVGIYHEEKQAENLVTFGCYLPYRMPQSLRSYFTLLDRLGIEYTFLEKEYCCGLPMVEMAHGEEKQRALDAAREFMTRNMAVGQELGAKRMVHFCLWCAALGKSLLAGAPLAQMYFPDLILDKLRAQNLRVQPAVVGYYEGCHVRIKGFAPGVKLNWKGYREILDRIQGLKVIDLQRRCCIDSSQRVVEQAERLNLGMIVTSCASCNGRIGRVARGKIRMKYFPDLLLAALDGAAL